MATISMEIGSMICHMVTIMDRGSDARTNYHCRASSVTWLCAGNGLMNYKDETWFNGTWLKGLPQRGKGKLRRGGWTYEGGIAKYDHINTYVEVMW